MDNRDHRVRLIAFKASDFRSLRDVSLGEEPSPTLPPIVLLYGENDTGKSNLIQAVGVWLRIAQALAGALSNGASGSDLSVDLYEGHERYWSSEDEESLDELQAILGNRPDDLFRYGTDRFELEGELSLGSAEDRERAYQFRFRVNREHGGTFHCQVLKAVWAGSAQGAKVPASDPDARTLRAGLGSAWQQIGAERRFGEEHLPVGPPTTRDPPSIRAAMGSSCGSFGPRTAWTRADGLCSASGSPL